MTASDMTSEFQDMANSSYDSVALDRQARGVLIPAVGTDLAINYGAGILRAPLIMPGKVVESICADLLAIDARVRVLFEQALASPYPSDALGLNDHQWAVVEQCLRVERELGLRQAYVDVPLLRADLLHTQGGEILIELNYTPACGGFDEELLHEVLTGEGDARAFPEPEENFGEVLDGLVERLVTLTGGNPGLVCLLDSTESYPSYRPRLELLAKLLGTRGISAVPADLDSVLVTPENFLVLGATGQRVNTVWRFFMLDEITTAKSAEAVVRVLRPWMNGTCQLFGSLVEEAKSSKSVLAWLWSDAASSSNFDQRIPETYVLGPLSMEQGGRRPTAVEAARLSATRSPEEWVMKDPFGHGGEGVLIGADVSHEEWTARLEAAVIGRRPVVLQRRVTEAGLAWLDDCGQERHGRLNLGIFLEPGARGRVRGHGGTFVRIAVQGDSKIGLSNGALTAVGLLQVTTEGKE